MSTNVQLADRIAVSPALSRTPTTCRGSARPRARKAFGGTSATLFAHQSQPGTVRMSDTRARTLVEKIWDDHVVAEDPGAPTVLAVDLHLVHEVTSPQAFTGLRQRALTVRRPGQTVATADHSIPTTDRSLPILDQMAAHQIRQLEENCREFGIPLHGIGSPHQ